MIALQYNTSSSTRYTSRKMLTHVPYSTINSTLHYFTIAEGGVGGVVCVNLPFPLILQQFQQYGLLCVAGAVIPHLLLLSVTVCFHLFHLCPKRRVHGPTCTNTKSSLQYGILVAVVYKSSLCNTCSCCIYVYSSTAALVLREVILVTFTLQLNLEGKFTSSDLLNQLRTYSAWGHRSKIVCHPRYTPGITRQRKNKNVTYRYGRNA